MPLPKLGASKEHPMAYDERQRIVTLERALNCSQSDMGCVEKWSDLVTSETSMAPIYLAAGFGSVVLIMQFLSVAYLCLCTGWASFRKRGKANRDYENRLAELLSMKLYLANKRKANVEEKIRRVQQATSTVSVRVKSGTDSSSIWLSSNEISYYETPSREYSTYAASAVAAEERKRKKKVSSKWRLDEKVKHRYRKRHRQRKRRLRAMK